MCLILEALLPLLPQGEESRGGPQVSPVPSFPHFCLHHPALGPQTMAAACHGPPRVCLVPSHCLLGAEAHGVSERCLSDKVQPLGIDGGLPQTNPLTRRAARSPSLRSGCPVRLASVFLCAAALRGSGGRRRIFPLGLLYPQCSHGDSADPGSPTTL